MSFLRNVTGKIKSGVSRNRVVSILRPLLIIALLFAGYYLVVGQRVESFIERQILAYSLSNGFGVRNSLVALDSSKASPTIDQYSSLLLQNDFGSLNSSTKLVTSDARVLAMQRFLIDYHSPLYPYSSVFIEVADEVGLDWRLVASISGVESAFGNLIPRGTNNGWGWKGGPNGDFSIFETWGNAISHITRRLAAGYGTDLSPFEIEPVYCPPCAANPAHAWANGVTKFMQELQYYYENLENL